MEFSLVTKISFVGMIVFGVLWRVTSGNIRYETVDGDIVSLKTVLFVITAICIGFVLASIFVWR